MKCATHDMENCSICYPNAEPEQPDLSLELDFNKAIGPGAVSNLIREQSILVQRIVTTSGPAFTELMCKLHDRVDYAQIALERGGFNESARGMLKLALAFIAKQIFIEVWRVAHKGQLAEQQTHNQGRKQVKRPKRKRK